MRACSEHAESLGTSGHVWGAFWPITNHCATKLRGPSPINCVTNTMTESATTRSGGRHQRCLSLANSASAAGISAAGNRLHLALTAPLNGLGHAHLHDPPIAGQVLHAIAVLDEQDLLRRVAAACQGARHSGPLQRSGCNGETWDLRGRELWAPGLELKAQGECWRGSARGLRQGHAPGFWG